MPRYGYFFLADPEVWGRLCYVERPEVALACLSKVRDDERDLAHRRVEQS